MRLPIVAAGEVNLIAISGVPFRSLELRVAKLKIRKNKRKIKKRRK
jgi:hypothetical protein